MIVSALPPKAAAALADRRVRFGPKGDIRARVAAHPDQGVCVKIVDIEIVLSALGPRSGGIRIAKHVVAESLTYRTYN